MRPVSKNVIAIILIFLLASILRFWQLGQVPPSPDWDEAALGYNAYSILKTGKDEYGTKFPLSLRSYDDYKPPLYVYLTVPSVALFGLNLPAVRLPSVLMGLFAVIGVYFLTRQFLELDREQKRNESLVPLLAALFLAISPWHIQFSRIAFEANTGLTINIWAAYALLKGRKTPWFLVLSTFLFGLSLYAYHSERIFAPLLFLIIISLIWRQVYAYKRTLITAVAVGLLTVIPLITVFLNPTTLMRLRGTSSLADQTGLLARSSRLLDDDVKAGNKWGIIFDNRRLVWAKTVFDGYISHYSFQWLFLNGDNPRHHAPDMGLLYLWELPFLLWGMVIVWKRGGKLATLLFGWFIIAPIPASVTTELPHAIRTLVFLPVFQIFTAFGVVSYFRWVNAGSKLRKYLIPVVGVLVLFNIYYYLHMYFVHMNHEFSRYWQYGYKQAVEYTEAHKNKYSKIVVSTKLEQPHMFFLFYTKYDPVKYLANGGTASGGFAEVKNRFDVYEFRPIHWDKEIRDGKTLYVGTPKEIPVGSLDAIRYLDGTDAIHIADH